MPYIKGDELLARLEDKELPLTNIQRLQIAGKVCDTINELHTNKKLIHRDIKPENFMLNIEGEIIYVTPIDFGLAKKIENDEFVHQDSLVVGTRYYIAPEIDRLQQYSTYSDIWAVGVMLAEIFGVNDKVRQHLREYHPFYFKGPDPTVNEFIDDWLEENDDEQINYIILDMLHPEPHKRISLGEASARLSKMAAPGLVDTGGLNDTSDVSYNVHKPDVIISPISNKENTSKTAIESKSKKISDRSKLKT